MYLVKDSNDCLSSGSIFKRSLMTLIYKLDNDPLETYEVRIANIYKTLFFDVLLGLYAMVDVSNEELKTYAAYDLLYPIFSPFLL